MGRLLTRALPELYRDRQPEVDALHAVEGLGEVLPHGADRE
jgi:hypothetical protein